MIQKIVKIFGYAIIFTLCAAFIIRCFMVADKSVFSELTVTDEMIAAYTEEQNEGFVQTVDVSPEIADDGYFSAYAFYYVPSIGQAQLTVRWNDSVYDYVGMEFGVEFEFELLNETTGISYPARIVGAKEKTLYNFRKLIIDGVELGPDDEIVAVMKLRDGFTSTQVVCYGEQPMENYKLSKGEKALLLGEGE